MRRSCVALVALALSGTGLAQSLVILDSGAVGASGQFLARSISGNGRVIVGSSEAGNGFEEVPCVWRFDGGVWTRTLLPVASNTNIGFTQGGRAMAASFDGDVVVGSSRDLRFNSLFARGLPTVWTGVLSGTPVGTVPAPMSQGLGPVRGILTGVAGDGSVASGHVTLSPEPSQLIRVQASLSTTISPAGATSAYLNPFMLFGGGTMSRDGTTSVGTRLTNPNSVGPLNAFRWSAATGFVELPGQTGSNPAAFRHSVAETISASGQVVGGFITPDPGVINAAAIPCLWEGTTLIELGLAPGLGNWAHVNALSADGSIAGGFQFPETWQFDYRGNAVLWINRQPVGLNTYLAGLGIDVQGFTPRVVTGISADGTVISGVADQKVPGASFVRRVSFVATIPTPSAGSVMVIAGLVAARRRR